MSCFHAVMTHANTSDNASICGRWVKWLAISYYHNPMGYAGIRLKWIQMDQNGMLIGNMMIGLWIFFFFVFGLRHFIYTSACHVAQTKLHHSAVEWPQGKVSIGHIWYPWEYLKWVGTIWRCKSRLRFEQGPRSLFCNPRLLGEVAPSNPVYL